MANVVDSVMMNCVQLNPTPSLVRSSLPTNFFSKEYKVISKQIDIKQE